MEPLTHLETNFCISAEETVRLIQKIDHPNFRLLLDTKAMTFEKDGRPATIRKYAPYLAHYHANDENLNGPGSGNVDFGPIFDALRDIAYNGYASVEVFKFDPGPEAIARKSLAYMKSFF
jgi:sugar phosphate isomerase/epimerase